MGRRVPSPAWGASWAPPTGFGEEPRPKTDSGVFWRPQNAPFCTYMTKSDREGAICVSVPFSKFWGTCPPSPVIYVHGAANTHLLQIAKACNTDADRLSLFLWPWPWPDNLDIQAWPDDSCTCLVKCSYWVNDFKR